MTIKRIILLRIYLAFGCVALAALIIFLQAARIQFVEGDKWKGQASNNTRIDIVEADRGNVYDSNGRLMATSVPVFTASMDPNAQGLDSSRFHTNIDTLSELLSNFSKIKYTDQKKHWSPGVFRKHIESARNKGRRFIPLFQDLNYADVKKLKSWPLFSKGQNKSGLIITRNYERVMPFGELMRRTIGGVRGNNIQPVGLEGYFDDDLSGKWGMRLMARANNQSWIPVNEDLEVLPENGNDLYTTLDIEIQDIAQSALLGSLLEHKADHGTAIVMEVATGEIKAIANLGSNGQGQYYEMYNYAVGEGVEPGSTFKLATMAALLETGAADVNTKVAVDYGKHKFCTATMLDVSKKYRGTIEMAEVFEVSSNVGFGKTVHKAFKDKPGKFVNQLKRFGLTDKTGIEIKGEFEPSMILNTDKEWNTCVTLPWLSIGYSVQISPLQMLTFYNAIANDGVHIQPHLVKGIKEADYWIEDYSDSRNSKRICSEQTAKTLQQLLINVVESGTGENIKSDKLILAGKTGTALMSDGKKGYQEKRVYNSSFAGFFPGDNPKYSCIVVINDPDKERYYGSQVAAPVFKKIAENILSSTITKGQLIADNNEDKKVPNVGQGYAEDHLAIIEALNVNQSTQPQMAWAKPVNTDREVDYRYLRFEKNTVPDVKGMSLKDAIYLLENIGLKVMFSGSGKVKDQSIEPGKKIEEGKTIKIELS